MREQKMFDLNSDKEKSFRDIVHECFDKNTHINEAETLHWNQLSRKERVDFLKDARLPSSFSRDDWRDLDYRAKEMLGKMINKTTSGEFALKETIEIYDDVDAKTVALYNKAKAKAIKVAADAKAPASGDAAPAPDEEKKKKKDSDDSTEEQVTTYKGKKPKKADKTLEIVGNSKNDLEESNNMEQPKRTNVNPFGEQDKLTQEMPDILASIRSVTNNQITPDEFTSLAKDVAETHKTSQNNLRADIMDKLRTTNKIYSNAEIHKFQGMVSKELESE